MVAGAIKSPTLKVKPDHVGLICESTLHDLGFMSHPKPGCQRSTKTPKCRGDSRIASTFWGGFQNLRKSCPKNKKPGFYPRFVALLRQIF